ncbi:c-type cytochrome [Prochlorococcus marinus]|uniref:c-type cytochrome n=1 Tax=Prochlorococcus TaxID=1218 RepID=UPI0007B3BCCB|nr:c-type cytochrome [Prochlorococcus marinus]KZR76619.1 Cytochrome c [Prochlorococcus marinus str. MIT 1323]
MTDPSSNNQSKNGFIGALVVLAAAVSIAILLWVLGHSQRDPYVNATLDLEGSLEQGGRLFRINCAGCHGITAQGNLGPNLLDVSKRRNDAQLIRQVVSGNTPPMPRFQLEPQEMADLLAYLNSLN